MKNRYRLLLVSLLMFSLLDITACTRGQVMREPNQPAKVQQIHYKEWLEASNRLPFEEHRKHIQNMSQLFPGVVFYKGNPNKKWVALTFDDGPDNFYTYKILDILHEKKAPATFFIVGKEAKMFPEVLKRIVSEGHDIGNHTWDHPNFHYLNTSQVKQEIQKAEDEIQRITGKRTNLFRPPYGITTIEDIREIHNLGYRVIDWSVDTVDWKGTSAREILTLVNQEVSPGGIIVQHCMAGKKGELDGTVKALPQIIDRLRAQGYELVTVHTLLGS
jgi:peptidoglycan/xylan/chitin deacetylase (PgdA/CDA1 family)